MLWRLDCCNPGRWKCLFKLLVLLLLVNLVLRKAFVKAFKPNSSDGRQPGNCLTTPFLLVGDILEFRTFKVCFSCSGKCKSTLANRLNSQILCAFGNVEQFSFKLFLLLSFCVKRRIHKSFWTKKTFWPKDKAPRAGCHFQLFLVWENQVYCTLGSDNTFNLVFKMTIKISIQSGKSWLSISGRKNGHKICVIFVPNCKFAILTQ